GVGRRERHRDRRHGEQRSRPGADGACLLASSHDVRLFSRVLARERPRGCLVWLGTRYAPSVTMCDCSLGCSLVTARAAVWFGSALAPPPGSRCATVLSGARS